MTDVVKEQPQGVQDAIAAAEEKEIRSRKDRPTNSVHFGDSDFEVPDEYGDATWGEVCRACCTHTPLEWGYIFMGLCAVVFFLYFFLFGLELLGAGAKVMTGCAAGSLFGDDANPVAGLMIGILATVLLQSSSTTTSIIVALVGADAVSVNQGIYMVMGSNIGTSVTNTIVAMGQMGNGDELERAFAGATVHDMFNFLSVAILFPLEVITHYLAALTAAIVAGVTTSSGEKWEGPIKKILGPLITKVIIANKKVPLLIAENSTAYGCEADMGFYPIMCEDPANPTYDSCEQVGLITCDKQTNACPAFFQADANAHDDKVSGGVAFIMGLAILFVCLFALVSVLNKMLMGMSTRIIYKATDINGYLAMLIGAGLTIIVQSSSITTSALTPIVGMGIIRLEQMYPLTLGANIGTTITALLASMVTDGTNALQVALAHLFFNITGILIWYPIPFMRRVPLYGARQLGKATRIWRGFPFLYIFVMFFVVELFFLGLSLMYEQKKIGLTVLASFITIAIGLGLIYLGYWTHFKGGKQHCIDCFAKRERKRLTQANLSDDMDFLKAKVGALIEYTGLPADEEGEDCHTEAKSLMEKSVAMENAEQEDTPSMDEVDC